MNQTVTDIELKNATSRILRWRIPLFLALLANIGAVARMAFMPGGAVAAPPTIASPLVADQKPTLPAADVGQLPHTCPAPAVPTPSSADIAAHALDAAQVETDANPTAVADPPRSATFPAADANSLASNSATGSPSSPEGEATLDVSDYIPALTELAADWWPAVESAAEAAARLATAHQPRAGELTISNLQQNGVPVSFLVDGRVYTLHPGESHLFPTGTSWTLQFHRGGQFANASQSLTPGEYRFVVGSNGWALHPSR